jgi:hypothetical protein
MSRSLGLLRAVTQLHEHFFFTQLFYILPSGSLRAPPRYTSSRMRTCVKGGALTNVTARAPSDAVAKSLHGRPAAGRRRVGGGRRESALSTALTDRGRCTWPVLRAETGRGALLRPPMERGTAFMGGASQTLLRPSEGAAGRRPRRMRCTDGRH